MSLLAPELSAFLSTGEWKIPFSKRTLDRGWNYHLEHRVGEVTCIHADDQSLATLRAAVSGEGNAYEVEIEFEFAATGDVNLYAECSCPVVFDCKHAAALIFHHIEKSANPIAFEPEEEATPGPLPEEVESWLDDFSAAAGQGKELGPPGEYVYPPSVRSRLVYLLQQDSITQRVVLSLASVLLRKDGYLDHASRANIEDLENPPSYVSPHDREILRRIFGAGTKTFSDTFAISGESWSEIVERMLETGRCYWESHLNPPLKSGAPREGEPVWEMEDTGMQGPRLRVDPPETGILGSAPFRYVDANTNECGVIDCELPPAALEKWLQAPPLTPSTASKLVDELGGARSAASLIPVPKAVTTEEHRDIAPKPGLQLIRADALDHRYRFYALDELRDMRLAVPKVFYDDRAVDADVHGSYFQFAKNEKIHRVHRDPKAEEKLRESFARIPLTSAGDAYGGQVRTELASALTANVAGKSGYEGSWLWFMNSVVPELERSGWQIEVAEDFGIRIVEADDWFERLEEGSGCDWLEFHYEVDVEGQTIQLLPLLLELLASGSFFDPDALELAASRGETVLLPLADGDRHLRFPADRLNRILAVLTQLFVGKEDVELKGGAVVLDRLAAARLAATSDGTSLIRQTHTALVSLGEGLERLADAPLSKQPRGFQAELRDYQKQGYEWFRFLSQHGLNGILADDMGLGKTVQTLAFLLDEVASGRAAHPSLVIAPTSVIPNWKREAEKFAPDLKVLVLQGAERKRSFGKIADCDVVLTSFPLLVRDAVELLKQPYHCVILDEAQNIKNPKAKAAQIACQVQCDHRFCLTGTPIENHLGELWSLFQFLMPGMLGTEPDFRRVYRQPIERGGDENRQRALSARIAPLMLRRTKSQVVTELPPKTEIVHHIELTDPQKELYETVRIAMDKRVREEIAKRGVEQSQIIILDALLKLRQICCHPKLLNLETARKTEESSKMDFLVGLLEELIPQGRNILIFSQFTKVLGLVEKELAQREIGYVKLTGQTKDRELPVQRFQNGEVPVFLISLKAGGTGLNLTRADTVIHYDPWWNPAAENQATDRAYRIGQENPVFVHKLICLSSIEEKIYQLQQFKADLAQGLLGGKEGKVHLEKGDLEKLLEPLGA